MKLLINKVIVLFILLLAISLYFLHSKIAQADEYRIGVYYFPGWKDHQVGAPWPLPWESIKAYPDREPMLGWYKEGEDNVTETHLKWMTKYNISFVVYDWYWGGGRALFDHALSSYLKVSNKYPVGFSLLWANHSDTPKSEQDFSSMVTYWCQNYFKNSHYQMIDGKPVIYIFSANRLEENAAKFGKNTKDLFILADSIAQSYGFEGVYFVGGLGAYDPFFKKDHDRSSYSAYSAYNYHTGRKSKLTTPFEFSHSYEQLANGYEYQWEWFLHNQSTPYIIPMTAGWNKKPWGGSKDSNHDFSFSTPEEFKEHLMVAKQLMDKYPNKTHKTGVICCWNEFGEGSIVEPTKKFGFKYLETINSVFYND